LATHQCVVCVETPESRTQVFMSGDGELAVHDNVVFEANTAAEDGGAVSRPLEIGFTLP
jgi:hypothetical protein